MKFLLAMIFLVMTSLEVDTVLYLLEGMTICFLKKIDMSGEALWTQTFRFYPTAFSISKLNDGNYITIGGWDYTGTGDFLVKLNPRGEKIWSKSYNGLKVLVLEDNGFVAITGVESWLQLARSDENGDELWKKRLDNVEWNTDQTIKVFNYDMEYFVATYMNIGRDLNILVWMQTQ